MALDLAIAISENLDPEAYSTELKDYVEAFNQGNYSAVLQQNSIQLLLRDDDAFLPSIIEKVKSYVTRSSDSHTEEIRQQEVLCAAVACLYLFIQDNHVGPFAELPEYLQGEKISKQAFNALVVDGEPVYHLAKGVQLLAIAKAILTECLDNLSSCLTAHLWAFRCVRMHQALLLGERSPTLKQAAMSLIDKISKNESLMTDDKYREVQIQFHLEAGYVLYFYYEGTKAEQHFEKAQALSNISVELTGMLGKRTRFQQEDKTQLVLKVKHKDEPQSNQSGDAPATNGVVVVDKAKLPHICPMDDDTLLDNIELKDSERLVPEHLSVTEQALLLGLLHDHRKRQVGLADIIRDEVNAYTQSVLSEPQSWCVQTVALYLRTQVEQDSSRRMQRSITQIEELVAEFKKEEPTVCERISYVFSTNMPLHCDVEAEAARIYSAVGSVSSALEVFLRLEMWEDVIKSYSALGRREKAETTIRERLAVEETPSLYCYLGDVTDEPTHYVTAWELSNQKFGRAQRCLALYYLRKCEFERSLAHFALTLERNSLQVGVWFSYGCAAMACEQFSLAATAFRHCVTLDSNNFEAWSNLAAALLKTDQKVRAFPVLKEALKCEYENWRLWENCLLVAADIGEFEEVIRAYHRLVDLKDKHADPDVLRVLVRAVNEDLPDAKEHPSGRLRPKVQQLFGRVTSKVTTNADIWRLYAELLHGDVTAPNDVKQRALQYLQKAHRCTTQALGWERDLDKCKNVAKESSALGKVYVDVASRETDSARVIQVLSGGRLMVKGVITKMQNQHRDPVTDEYPEDIVRMCDELRSVSEQIEQALARARDAS